MIGGRLKNCTVSVLLLVFACMPRERRKQRPLPRDALSLHAAVRFFWKPYSPPGGKLYSLEKGRAICALTCNCSDTAVREQQPLFAVQQSSLQQICYTSSPQSSYHMARRMIRSKRAWPSAPAPPPSTLHCTLLRTVALSSVAQRAPRRVPGARSAARRKAQRGGGVLAQ